MDGYRARMETHRGAVEEQALARSLEKIERELRLAALKAERREIFRRVRHRQLGSETARRLVRELDLQEVRYAVAGG